jgi:formylglycine-generating enzyme required for sulfatase activity
MNPIAIRELARIQSLLHVLKTQRDTLSELSDIQAFRGLEESYRDDLEEAQKRGLVALDPVGDVRSDWLRLVSWSNRIQLALRAADNLGNDLDTLSSKPDKESGKKKKKMEEEWRPSLSDLQQLKMALEGAPRVLVDAIEQGCRELQLGDWSSGRPYGELAEVADAMEWTEKLELAESPGAWAHGIGLRERPLVASRLAVERSSSLIERRLRSLKDRLARVVEMIMQHRQHASTLAKVGHLTVAGQVDSARQMMTTVQAMFADLDYSAKDQKLSEIEKSLQAYERKVVESADELKALGREASEFFVGPPLSLRHRARAMVTRTEKLMSETSDELRRWPSGSEMERRLTGWCVVLKKEVDGFKTGPMNRLRRWIVGTSLAWLVVLVTGWLMFQQSLVRQERGRQRLVAEAKAAEERAKAAAEERERQRLVAEAKAAEERAKAAAEERERQRLVAEAKASEERAKAEAKSKAEAEEREHQRLAAEAKAAEERARAEAKSKAEAVMTRLVSGTFAAGEKIDFGFLVKWVPAGRFRMGSPEGEEGRYYDELPHQVSFTKGFFLAETECTQAQWQAVMGTNPSSFKGADRPVEMVDWESAVEYCRKLTVKQRSEGLLPHGWEWRLPTEAEWEYAARAGSDGPRYGELERIAWYLGNSGRESHPVKQRDVNPWGLYDMIGNVWEWCSDKYSDYPSGKLTDPINKASNTFNLRVERGGGWANISRDSRSATRRWCHQSGCANDIGFRTALSSVR